MIRRGCFRGAQGCAQKAHAAGFQDQSPQPTSGGGGTGNASLHTSPDSLLRPQVANSMLLISRTSPDPMCPTGLSPRPVRAGPCHPGPRCPRAAPPGPCHTLSAPPQTPSTAGPTAQQPRLLSGLRNPFKLHFSSCGPTSSRQLPLHLDRNRPYFSRQPTFQKRAV